MANDSIEIIDPFDFHPCDTPRGCLYYDTSILTADQQYKLNDYKNNLIRSNQKYLKRHPEIRAFVSLICRHVFKRRPRQNVHLAISEFFYRPKRLIEDEVRAYIESNNLGVQEEDVEEEKPGEDQIDYYLFQTDEGEEEESNDDKLSYMDVFKTKSNVERDYITEIIYQQFSGEMDDYNNLNLYGSEIAPKHSKSETTASTENLYDRKSRALSRVAFDVEGNEEKQTADGAKSENALDTSE